MLETSYLMDGNCLILAGYICIVTSCVSFVIYTRLNTEKILMLKLHDAKPVFSEVLICTYQKVKPVSGNMLVRI